MATESDIQQLIKSADNKCKMYQRTIEDCDKQIARLKPVYQKLSEIKADFRNARKSTEGIFEEKGTWRGERYTSFCNAGAVLDDAYGEYYNRLDAAHDEVNRKMGELKAKKKRLIPLIGELAAQIELWSADIQNAGN